MILSLMVAISKNLAIGKDNKLLWHLSDDLKNFKRVTTGKPVIMGRKTYESIGRPLPKRPNIVITRNPDLKIEGVTVVHSLQEAMDFCKDTEEAVVIGGGAIYEESLPLVSKMYITYVDCEIPEADVFFPKFSTDSFEEKDCISWEKDEKNQYDWKFVEYSKI